MGRGFIALVVAALVLLVGAAQSSAAVTLTVDDNLACAGSTFTTITAAVAAAAPGDTVKICPGVYDETVVVNKAITIKGSSLHPDTSSCNSTETTSSRAFVTGDDGTANNTDGAGADSGPAFQLTVSGVTLWQLVVTGVKSREGIKVDATTSGHTIKTNLIQHNTFGLYLNTNGATPTTVSGNCFRFNDEAGSASGNGIYSDQGVKNVKIVANKLFENGGGAGIYITSPAPGFPTVDAITVKANISTGDEEGVAIQKSTNSVIQSNIILRPNNRGIFIGPRNTNLKVKGNIVQDSLGDGIRVRAKTTDDAFDAALCSTCNATSSSLIASNIVQRSTDNGIRIDFFGAGTTALKDSTIKSNIVQSSGRDGLYIGEGSRNNKVQRNILQVSAGSHDCHDENTSIPLNVWTNNIGGTQNIGGLCFTATTVGPATHAPE